MTAQMVHHRKVQERVLSDEKDGKRSGEKIYRDAQRKLVASLLVDDSGIDQIISVVTPEDFSDPAMSTIYASIVSLVRNETPISSTAVAIDLESEGNLENIGGITELEDLYFNGERWLTELPPKNRAYMIKDHSVKRNTTEIIDSSQEGLRYDSGISGKKNIEELQHKLTEELYAVSDDSTTTKIREDFGKYADLIQERKKIYEENKDANDGLQGIPSNIESLNNYTTGWLPGQLITCAARTAVGKALALDTLIPTADGQWTTMREVGAGDVLLDRYHQPTSVTAVTEVQYDRTCYQVRFSNGDSVVADEDHQWSVIREESEEAVQTTGDIISWLHHYGHNMSNCRIRRYSHQSASSEDSDGSADLYADLYVVGVDEVQSVPVKCIEVDNSEHVYLVGRTMVPTHNSVFAVNSAVAAARANKSVLFFSLEMSSTEIQDRVYSSISSIPMKELKQGNLSEESQIWFQESMKEFSSLKITLDTDPQVTVDNIRAKAIKQAQSHEGLDFIVIDYLQLIVAQGRFNSRQEAVADISRQVKLLAKQLEVPIMVLAQLNRKDKDSEEDRPRLDHIRESHAIAQDSDIVILLHRNTDSQEPDPRTYIFLEKNRNGESSQTIICRSDLACSKFEEIPRAVGKTDEQMEDTISDTDYDDSLRESEEMFASFDDELSGTAFEGLEDAHRDDIENYGDSDDYGDGEGYLSDELEDLNFD